MKRYFLVLCLLLLLPVLCSCGEEEIRTIKIYNCVDYIDEAVLDDFVDYFYEKHGERIDYIYDTFETPEIMLNQIKTGKKFDLICPSDYTIQKMLKENTDDLNGVIRIGMYTHISLFMLPDVMNEFKEKYPNAKFSIYCTANEDMLEKLRNNELDFVVLQYPIFLNEKSCIL